MRLIPVIHVTLGYSRWTSFLELETDLVNYGLVAVRAATLASLVFFLVQLCYCKTATLCIRLACKGGARWGKMDKTRYIFILRSRIRSQIMRKATVKIERESDITESLQRQ